MRQLELWEFQGWRSPISPPQKKCSVANNPPPPMYNGYGRWGYRCRGKKGQPESRRIPSNGPPVSSPFSATNVCPQVAEVLPVGGHLLCSFELWAEASDIEMWGARKHLHTEASVRALLQDRGFEVLEAEVDSAAYYYEGIPVPYLMVVALRGR